MNFRPTIKTIELVRNKQRRHIHIPIHIMGRDGKSLCGNLDKEKCDSGDILIRTLRMSEVTCYPCQDKKWNELISEASRREQEIINLKKDISRLKDRQEGLNENRKY